jgi:NADPH-dependent 2,4-dienoyl-CoA reductase/sulfur reductase-like enzyme
MGAGGLQALVKGGFSVAGKRIVVAGTGPLLLAVAAHLQQDGAHIVSIAEQAPTGAMLSFATKLWSHPAKLMQGAKYLATLLKTAYRLGCWPIAAEGTTHLTAVQLTNGRDSWTEPCDFLAVGFHLVPNTELAQLLDCRLQGDHVAVDANQQTSVHDIYCAGEPAGIAGLEAAILQGAIAGLAASGRAAQGAAKHSARNRQNAFGRALEQAFALRPELRSLPASDTIVCRCEDVHYSRLRDQLSWTDAKLQTRLGMGPCQGRICGPAVQTLFGWRNTSVRPPIFPLPLSALGICPADDRNQNATSKETQ